MNVIDQLDAPADLPPILRVAQYQIIEIWVGFRESTEVLKKGKASYNF
jgi:hypothetical protein